MRNQVPMKPSTTTSMMCECIVDADAVGLGNASPTSTVDYMKIKSI